MEDELSAAWTQVLKAKGIQKMMTIGVTNLSLYVQLRLHSPTMSRGKYRQTNV